MNLSDFNSNELKAKRFHKIFESRFGRKINFDKLDVAKAVQLVNKVEETLTNMKKTVGFQNAQNSPAYCETIMIKEGLDNWLHIKLGINHTRKLTEGEIEQAEAVLAAKDFVDRLQKMLEEVGRILNEDLPPLSDVIRDQMGSDVATAYSTATSGALIEIQTALATGRQELDSAARVLAGEEDAMGAMDMGEPVGDEMGMGGDELGMDPEMDLAVDDGMGGGLDDGMGGDVTDFEMDDAAIGGDLDLGREER